MSPAVPTWWPPKIGALLRHETRHAARGGGVKPVNALLHVSSVFKDCDGAQRIVTAEWFPTKRYWSYVVRCAADAAAGSIWPDGAAKPPRRG